MVGMGHKSVSRVVLEFLIDKKYFARVVADQKQGAPLEVVTVVEGRN
jgi:hypothetical protein